MAHNPFVKEQGAAIRHHRDKSYLTDETYAIVLVDRFIRPNPHLASAIMTGWGEPNWLTILIWRLFDRAWDRYEEPIW